MPNLAEAVEVVAVVVAVVVVVEGVAVVFVGVVVVVVEKVACLSQNMNCEVMKKNLSYREFLASSDANISSMTLKVFLLRNFEKNKTSGIASQLKLLV